MKFHAFLITLFCMFAFFPMPTVSAPLVIEAPFVPASSSSSSSPAKNIDLDKLAYAVSIAETSGCMKGSALSHHNCFGIMIWPKGIRELKTYNTDGESFQDFKDLWLRKYGDRFPTPADAERYSGGEGIEWLSNVKAAYYK